MSSEWGVVSREEKNSEERVLERLRDLSLEKIWKNFFRMRKLL